MKNQVVICGCLVLSIAYGCSVPSPFNPGVRISSAQLDPPRGWCSAAWFGSGRPWNQQIVLWVCKDDFGNVIYESPGMSESAAASAASAAIDTAGTLLPPLP
ncbi:MAG TPA: hypothetical protein VMU16_14685 [Candidatus Binataceae bacterium]|nr:hypothetical protein [Candidatus Binataceae bacterium]